MLSESITSPNEVEQSISEGESGDLTSRCPQPDLLFVLELNDPFAVVDAATRVDGDLHTGLDVAVNLPSTSLEVERSDGRMVADLLQEHRAAVHPALIGLSKDGIEWLVHFETHETYTQRKAEDVLEPLDWISGFAGLL